MWSPNETAAIWLVHMATPASAALSIVLCGPSEVDSVDATVLIHVCDGSRRSVSAVLRYFTVKISQRSTHATMVRVRAVMRARQTTAAIFRVTIVVHLTVSVRICLISSPAP